MGTLTNMLTTTAMTTKISPGRVPAHGQQCLEPQTKAPGELGRLRLYQLVSPSLPVGGFTYSQGLEWAIERGWVKDPVTLGHWLRNQLKDSLATLELPLLMRLCQALAQEHISAASDYCRLLLASRETAELRQEERQRGQAFAKLLPQLGIPLAPEERELVLQTQLAAFALAAKHWQLPTYELCEAYCWSWLENAVTAGVKLIPLGQSAGQQLLLQLSTEIPEALQKAQDWPEADIGSYTPALAIASARHETQYTRLFRS